MTLSAPRNEFADAFAACQRYLAKCKTMKDINNFPVDMKPELETLGRDATVERLETVRQGWAYMRSICKK